MKKPIIKDLPKCGKCGKTLEPQFTTEQEEGSKNKPKVLMMFGKCDKCKVITMCDIIKIKDIPSENDFDNFAKSENQEISICEDGCYCATKTIKGKCGKCGAEKSEVKE